jgi:hypothetical protein
MRRIVVHENREAQVAEAPDRRHRVTRRFSRRQDSEIISLRQGRYMDRKIAIDRLPLLSCPHE